ncbi:MAG: dihydroorotase [Tannerellaceae bacterium]|jgi:dihydroorotase|nr:dihydroorotase [Tannerellaceae bacterium]
MEKTTVIYNAHIVNEGRTFHGAVEMTGDKIANVYEGIHPRPSFAGADMIDAGGRLLLPGVIDSHVHFRDPGLTHKGSIATESAAAVAGGVTTFMDMPNTVPPTTTIDALERKLQRASEASLANYAFFFGATNDNFNEVKKLDPSRTPGVKLFLASSTGDMQVDRNRTIERLLGESGHLIAVHAEDEALIKRNASVIKSRFKREPDASYHPMIRSEEACYVASSRIVEMAVRMGVRLHLLHLSTAREITLLDGWKPLSEKKITAEACVPHLWFCDLDYATRGSRIKCNPAIKATEDRSALRKAVKYGYIDTIATDHAPHLLQEKEGGCFSAASGMPMVQHSLVAMLELVSKQVFRIEKVVEKMSHNPAELFRIDRRGYIRPGYFADLVLVTPSKYWTVSPNNVLYKCKWSPLEGCLFGHKVWKTFVNGRLAYDNGPVANPACGKEIAFSR